MLGTCQPPEMEDLPLFPSHLRPYPALATHVCIATIPAPGPQIFLYKRCAHMCHGHRLQEPTHSRMHHAHVATCVSFTCASWLTMQIIVWGEGSSLPPSGNGMCKGPVVGGKRCVWGLQETIAAAVATFLFSPKGP